jgi:hypothetical protein
MNKQFPLILLLAALVGLPVRADNPAPAPMAPATSAKTPPHFTYLTGDEEVWSTFPKAPTLGSPVDEDDLIITLSAQANRTDDQKKEAMTDQHWSIKLISGVIDPDFDTKYPATFDVLKKAATDAGQVNEKVKHENKRLRPVRPAPYAGDPAFPGG